VNNNVRFPNKNKTRQLKLIMGNSTIGEKTRLADIYGEAVSVNYRG
jgi:hypothetical protein